MCHTNKLSFCFRVLYNLRKQHQCYFTCFCNPFFPLIHASILRLMLNIILKYSACCAKISLYLSYVGPLANIMFTAVYISSLPMLRWFFALVKKKGCLLFEKIIVAASGFLVRFYALDAFITCYTWTCVESQQISDYPYKLCTV